MQQWKIVVLSLHTYSIGNEQLGSIAILGPTRMEYSRVISLTAVFSK